jgi:hypothetical protein
MVKRPENESSTPPKIKVSLPAWIQWTIRKGSLITPNRLVSEFESI